MVDANEALRSLLWALLLAFGVTVVIGPWVIKALQKLKVGQNIYELAPEEHKKKQGTPTMTGLMFMAVSIVVALLFRRGGNGITTDLMLAVALFALLNLVLGFLDDYTKLRGGKNQGLSERQKLAGQFLIALLFSLYCYFHPLIGPKIIMPFFGTEWNLGPFYIPVMMFVIICTTNGANLLDGLDGLLGGVTSVISGFFAVCVLLLIGGAAALLGPEAIANYQNIGLLCAALCGALLGYLAYNVYPARMMMGDTGSMYLGGIVAGVAMVLRLPLLIPLVAGAYAASLLSVFMQRWYFRLSGGKRIFKMSPLHHHFELTGVKETKIVSMYILATVILCLIGLLGIA